jgi:hypothetical protein
MSRSSPRKRGPSALAKELDAAFAVMSGEPPYACRRLGSTSSTVRRHSRSALRVPDDAPRDHVLDDGGRLGGVEFVARHDEGEHHGLHGIGIERPILHELENLIHRLLRCASRRCLDYNAGFRIFCGAYAKVNDAHEVVTFTPWSQFNCELSSTDCKLHGPRDARMTSWIGLRCHPSPLRRPRRRRASLGL